MAANAEKYSMSTDLKPSQVLTDSQFLGADFMHGGVRRSMQIAEILAEFSKTGLDQYSSKVAWGYYAVQAIRGLHLDRENRRKLRKQLSLEAQYEAALKSRPSLLVWENTQCASVPKLAAGNGTPVIALPHNIEALSNPHSFVKSNIGIFGALESEISALKLCRQVFTISNEDAWLFRQFGIESTWLPYFPPAIIRSKLEGVRRKREAEVSERTFVLVVGTADNPHTYNGMRALIQLFKKAKHKLKKQVVIVGWGTNRLMNESTDSLRILGAVDEVQLYELLTNCDCMFTVQPSGTGALTRVPEAVLAGVPVICDQNASRSTEWLDGVRIYQSEDHAIHLLKQSCAVPAAPKVPDASRELFKAVQLAVMV